LLWKKRFKTYSTKASLGTPLAAGAGRDLKHIDLGDLQANINEFQKDEEIVAGFTFDTRFFMSERHEPTK